MPVLHNRINNEELKRRLYEEQEPRTTVSFYKYFHVDHPEEFRNELYRKFVALKVFGRIYIAREGINAQVSVPQSLYPEMVQTLYHMNPELNAMRMNIAVDDDGKSFWVLRIKVRPKIVADGIDDPNFDPSNMGVHLDAASFNTLTENPDAIVVDMRNHYEYEVGHFQNALEIPSDTFREQLPMAVDMLKEHKDKPIIMYCTGGIRCEKASAYMKYNGFTNVYQLEGGIIQYARKAKEEKLPLKFVGKNFVFDERLGERITEDVIAQCHQCGAPADTHINCKNEGCHLLFIQCTECAKRYEQCCSSECQEILHLPEEERLRLRAGVDRGKMIFNKSQHHPLRRRSKADDE